jgi:hypothetical protein
VERAEVLFDASTYLSDNYHYAYDIEPDGKHFIMIAPAESGGGDLILVVNWLDELRERVGK